MEKLGKYQGNSISGLNSTSSRLPSYSDFLPVFQLSELDMYIYEELENSLARQEI